ncbi:glycosyltransferase, partial [Patescibacteria group bacterium]|nr:glycosyltransferase [Patescibacteria group bacterium]
RYSLFVKGIVIGFGEKYDNLKLKIKKIKLENKIFLIKNLPNAANHLKAFDIFVLPSLKEGLPYVLLEAGLAEIPIIATNVGGAPEIIGPALSRSDLGNLKRSDLKETGILVNPANPEQLAEAIKKLIENPELAKALAANARQKILSEFSFEKMLQQTLAAYEN